MSGPIIKALFDDDLNLTTGLNPKTTSDLSAIRFVNSRNVNDAPEEILTMQKQL